MGTTTESCNADILMVCFELLSRRQGSVEFVHVCSHADAALVEVLGLPPAAIVGNELADLFAGMAADAAQLDDREVSRINEITSLAKSI